MVSKVSLLSVVVHVFVCMYYSWLFSPYICLYINYIYLTNNIHTVDNI